MCDRLRCHARLTHKHKHTEQAALRRTAARLEDLQLRVQQQVCLVWCRMRLSVSVSVSCVCESVCVSVCVCARGV